MAVGLHIRFSGTESRIEVGRVPRNERALCGLDDHRLIRASRLPLLLVLVQELDVRVQRHLFLHRRREEDAGVVNQDTLVHALLQPLQRFLLARNVDATRGQALTPAVVLHDTLGVLNLAAEERADPLQLTGRDVEGQLADETTDGRLRRLVVYGIEQVLGVLLGGGIRDERDATVQAEMNGVGGQRDVNVDLRTEGHEAAAFSLVRRVAVVAGE